MYKIERRGIRIEVANEIVKTVVRECEICRNYNPKKKKFLFVTAYERGEK